jgi:hypothetical protein
MFPESVDPSPYYDSMRVAIDMAYLAGFMSGYDGIVRKIKEHNILTPEESKILEYQRGIVQMCVNTHLSWKKDQTVRLDLPSSPVYDDLKYKGVHSFTIGEDVISRATEILSGRIDSLLNLTDHVAAPHQMDRALAISPGAEPELFELFLKAFDEHKILEALSKSNGTHKNLTMTSINLHISEPTDTHHERVMRDLPASKTKLGNLHKDPKRNLMKSIIYLNNVDSESGPLITVPESFHWKQDDLDFIIASGNSIGNYLLSPAHRNVMKMFPDQMRGNAIFGGYYADGSGESDEILKNMVEHISEESNCMVFDPVKTAHMGGICKSKRRIALQILMR